MNQITHSPFIRNTCGKDLNYGDFPQIMVATLPIVETPPIARKQDTTRFSITALQIQHIPIYDDLLKPAPTHIHPVLSLYAMCRLKENSISEKTQKSDCPEKQGLQIAIEQGFSIGELFNSWTQSNE